MSKIIFHVDMDQFFVAVEVRNNPSLRGKPVVVGGGPNGRGIVTTASYEARKFGLHSGMPAIQAKRLCPQAIFLRGNSAAYIEVSRHVRTILREYTNLVEMLSVDEACLDVTDAVWSYPSVNSLAMQIKKHIQESEGVTASIGAGANRTVAKMACNLCKPDGFLYLPPAKVTAAYRDLPVGKLIGVGKSTEHSLLGLGIRTIGDLARYPGQVLRNKFGIRGPDLQRLARGGGNDVVLAPDNQPDEKSIGHEMTFGQDLTDEDDVRSRLLLLSEKVARRMRVARMAGRIVTLKLRYHGFETHFHSRKLSRIIWYENDIFAAACKLLAEIYDRSRPVRLVGISVSGLVPASSIRQQELFNTGADLDSLSAACDEVKDRYGEGSLGLAGGSMRPGGRRPRRGPRDYSVIPFRFEGMNR